MVNQYPPEFEEIYQRLIINKEEFREVINEYSDMMDKENMGIIRTLHEFNKYVKEKELSNKVE